MKPLSRWFMNTIIRLGTDLLCWIDKRDFHKVPPRGPLILVTNHIGSLEVPLLFVHLQPRKIKGLAKIETWDSKFMGWLFDLWEAIPVRRGEADLGGGRAARPGPPGASHQQGSIWSLGEQRRWMADRLRGVPVEGACQATQPVRCLGTPE
jgi:1-acyl-sn-glycerol-3-phosphate acyltransferase